MRVVNIAINNKSHVQSIAFTEDKNKITATLTIITFKNQPTIL